MQLWMLTTSSGRAEKAQLRENVSVFTLLFHGSGLCLFFWFSQSTVCVKDAQFACQIVPAQKQDTLLLEKDTISRRFPPSS